jgi:hypothetical protein
MIGDAVTSNICSGTCLILSIARHPNVSEAERADERDGRVRVDIAGRNPLSLKEEVSVFM